MCWTDGNLRQERAYILRHRIRLRKLVRCTVQTRIVVTGIIAFAAVTCGCGVSLAPSGMTSFAVSFESGVSSEFGLARATTMIQLGAVRCFLYSNTRDMPSYTPENYYACSGSHPLPNGEPVKWRCETEDGREFSKITVDSVRYELAKGRLFLLSRKEGVLQVMQLQTGLTKPSGSGMEDLIQLEKSHPEIRSVFEK